MVSRMRMVLLAVACVGGFLAGCAGMAVLIMWALLWPIEVLARVVGAS